MDTRQEKPESHNRRNRLPRRSPGQRLPEKFRTPSDILLLATLPYAAFRLLEWLFLKDNSYPMDIQLLNYLLYLALCLFLVGVTGRLKLGTRIFLGVMWLIGFINFTILSTRMTPIVPWDLLSFTTAIGVAANYDFPLNRDFFLYTACFAGLFLLTFFMTWRAEKRKRHMAALVTGTLALSGTMLFSMQPENRERFDLDDTLFVTRHMAETNGFILNFVYSMHYLKVAPPAEYSVQRVQEIEAAYKRLLSGRAALGSDGVLMASKEPMDGLDGGKTSPAKSFDPSRPALMAPGSPELKDLPEIERYLAIVNQDAGLTLAPGEKPDIVVVMNESFSDLRVVEDFETNIPMLPFLDHIRKNSIKGSAHPSIIGGNTATSEFEFLTGSSMAFLPSGSSPYQQYVNGPTPSLVSLLEEQGYGTAAMHPYHSRGWMRDDVYPYFGFDRVKFIYDFRNRKNIRSYISDESVFREIRLELNRPENKDQPQFVFAVTMQNHGGYYNGAENFDPKVEITSQEGNPSLNHYLSLVHETDRALGEFLAWMKVREKPTLVLFFGDHQPSDEAASVLTQGQNDLTLSEKRREVPFLLWANYEMEEETGVRTSLNFLSNMVLDHSSLARSPWHAFLKDVAAEVPAMNDAFYYTPDGTAVSHADLEELPQILKDYEIIQYNYLFDVQNRVDELFQTVHP